jgi:hypothetical protein
MKEIGIHSWINFYAWLPEANVDRNVGTWSHCQ